MHRQDEEDPVSAAATPRTKQAIKTLSSQVFCLLPEKILDFQTLFLQICLGSCQCHPIIIQQKKKKGKIYRESILSLFLSIIFLGAQDAGDSGFFPCVLNIRKQQTRKRITIFVILNFPFCFS